MFDNIGAVFWFLVEAPWSFAMLTGSPWVGWMLGVLVWFAIPSYMPILVFLIPYLVEYQSPSRWRRVVHKIAFTIGIIPALIGAIAVLILMVAFSLDLGLVAVHFIKSSATSWWFIPLAIGVTWLLYGMRCVFLPMYALVEILSGTAAIGIPLVTTSSSVGTAAQVISVLSGMYVMIRGLDNLDKSMKDLARLLPRRSYIRLRVFWEKYLTLRMRDTKGVIAIVNRERAAAELEIPPWGSIQKWLDKQ